MDDKAAAAIQRVVNNTETRTGFSFEFLAPFLLNLLAQWLNCGQPGGMQDHAASMIFKRAKRIRRKQQKRGEPVQPEVTIAMARQIAADAFDEWNESDSETQEALCAACPKVDLFGEDDDE